MMKKWTFVFLYFINLISYSQALNGKLTKAISEMEADPQLRHAIIGLCVMDNKTGKLIYEHNAQTGLAPASTQKIFTSCAAFDLLGKDYKYTTEIGYYKQDVNSTQGYLIIKPSGDPSFGSSRFASTKPVLILQKIANAVRQKKAVTFSNAYRIIDTAFSNAVPGGWVWEDIGNYYGAGAQSLNWLENQYDIVLKSGKRVGDKVAVVETKPGSITNLADNVKSAAKGTGDNTIVYLDYGNSVSMIEGTIPVDENAYVVGASITDPPGIFAQQLSDKLKADGIEMNDDKSTHPQIIKSADPVFNYTELYTYFSPPLDSLNYWFLKKSINLYGEAFLKTMAFQKSGLGSTEKGVELLKDFWSQHGIEKSALNICDGSGLSPQNRVTADALVKALQYARTRSWFNSFYTALPEYNGMKMKSGSIGGARAYAGYHTAKDGNAYSFAIIINNYDGAPGDTVKKMFRLLDNLK